MHVETDLKDAQGNAQADKHIQPTGAGMGKSPCEQAHAVKHRMPRPHPLCRASISSTGLCAPPQGRTALIWGQIRVLCPTKVGKQSGGAGGVLVVKGTSVSPGEFPRGPALGAQLSPAQLSAHTLLGPAQSQSSEQWEEDGFGAVFSLLKLTLWGLHPEEQKAEKRGWDFSQPSAQQ